MSAIANSMQKMHFLDLTGARRELDLASEVFHRINRVIPVDQKILSVQPDCSARNAISLMQKHGYSQLPVMSNGEVLGVFSFRSFARATANGDLSHWNGQRCAPGDLRVDELIEEFEFARVTEELSRVFDAMDRDNGILVGTPDRLIGVLTPMDFLRYLYLVASPFVTISEIELALRKLIESALTKEQITAAAKRSLSSGYGGMDKVPISLENMSFDNYQTLISNRENWKSFEGIFGGTRTRTSAKLKEIGDIRNDLFHFRREIIARDHEVLTIHRNWLLLKIKQLRIGPEEGSEV